MLASLQPAGRRGTARQFISSNHRDTTLQGETPMHPVVSKVLIAAAIAALTVIAKEVR